MTVSCKTFHYHLCPLCWHIWGHDGGQLAKSDDDAHRCPACGKGYHWMTLGKDEAARLAVAKDPFPEEYDELDRVIAESFGMLTGP